jgi:hypothetical protein
MGCREYLTLEHKKYINTSPALRQKWTGIVERPSFFAPEGGIFINPPPPPSGPFIVTQREKRQREKEKGGGVCPTAK